jgi:glycosyltransferase involved in cell wall biosynthesis
VRELHFIYPGDLATLTGGYVYDRRIIDGLSRLGWRVTTHSVDASFPEPTQAALQNADQILDTIADGQTVVIDGLALGGMPAQVGDAAARLRVIGLVHHPLALETGLDAVRANRLRDAERQVLRAVRRVIVTSRATARLLAEYDIPSERIAVVEPGTDQAPLARGSGAAECVLLCVGTLTPRKGHAGLLDALAKLRDRPWRLICAGSKTRSPETTAALARQIEVLNIDYRVSLVGDTAGEALDALYDRADVFVLASYLEGYGMALAEAIAHGLPVVGTRVGAAEEIVPPSAGILVPVGDGAALATALDRVISDQALHARLAAGARAARDALPRWQLAAARFAAAVQDVV